MIRLMELAHGTCWLLICFDLMILNKTDTKYGIQLLHKPNLPVSWALRTLAKKVCVWLIQGIQFWYTPIFIHFHGKRWWQPTGFPVAHGSLGTSFQSPRTRRSADKFSLESTDSDWIILDSRQGVMLVTGSTPDTKPQYKVFCTQNLFGQETQQKYVFGSPFVDSEYGKIWTLWILDTDGNHSVHALALESRALWWPPWDVLCTHEERGWHPEVSSPGTSQAKALCYQKKCRPRHPKMSCIFVGRQALFGQLIQNQSWRTPSCSFVFFWYTWYLLISPVLNGVEEHMHQSETCEIFCWLTDLDQAGFRILRGPSLTLWDLWVHSSKSFPSPLGPAGPEVVSCRFDPWARNTSHNQLDDLDGSWTELMMLMEAFPMFPKFLNFPFIFAGSTRPNGWLF